MYALNSSSPIFFSLDVQKRCGYRVILFFNAFFKLIIFEETSDFFILSAFVMTHVHPKPWLSKNLSSYYPL